jgi:hypothetical protein
LCWCVEVFLTAYLSQIFRAGDLHSGSVNDGRWQLQACGSSLLPCNGAFCELPLPQSPFYYN